MERLGGRGNVIEGRQTVRKRHTTVAVTSDTPGTAAGLMRRTASQAVACACTQQAWTPGLRIGSGSLSRFLS